MQYLGELISLGVAMSWTVAALASEVASKRLGVMSLNVWRLGLAATLTAVLMWVTTGEWWPVYAGLETWMWMLSSGFVGYFFGDYCLFNSYLTIGSMYGQLFMTLAPAVAALSAWVLLGQTMPAQSIVAMFITMIGIGIAITGKHAADGKHHAFSVQLPLKGILFGIGAGVGQGLGLVLSKVGMDHYMRDIPAEQLSVMEGVLPFSANFIRCLAGLACFSAVVSLHRRWGDFGQTARDGKGLGAMTLAVMSGPFLGVAFSLMAVNYTAAGIASTLMALTPILIIVPSYYLFKTPITLRCILGAVISVVGASLFFLHLF